ncbi:MAG: hypothetical protein JSV44_05875 [Candidatus Zixiibacteriota bacterium]|nr:MAG: hypothetical protein JSV44_05875 [candidate division Zixibacteria bacterium]
MEKRKKSLIWAVALMTPAIISITSPSVSAQDISAANISRYLGDGEWQWKVYIRASANVLDRIDYVEYRLHPTFPRPVRTVGELGDPRYPFGLESRGWGVFPIEIKIRFKNGDFQRLKHMLEFRTPPADSSLSITADNISTRVRSGLWRWTVFIQGPELDLEKIQCVQYTLHPTFYDPVREVCERGSGPHAFALTATGWGTFEIKIRLFLKDGGTQDLTHMLDFH